MNGVISNSIILLFLLIVLGIIIVLIAVFLADFKLAQLQNDARNIPAHKRKKLAVIIYARNNSDTLEHCLESLRRTRFRSLEMIVVDNASSDHTKQCIRRFQAQYPKLQLITVFKNKQSTKSEAVYQASKKIRRSENMLVINGNVLISKEFIRMWQGVREHTSLDNGIAIPLLPKISYSYVSVGSSYIEMSSYVIKKALVSFNLYRNSTANNMAYIGLAKKKYNEKNIPLNTTSYMQTPTYLPNDRKTYNSKIAYALNVAFLIATTYFIYLMLNTGISQPLFYSYLIIFTWLALMLTSIPNLKWTERIVSIVNLPIAYPLVYVLNGLRVLKFSTSQKIQLP